MKKITTESTKVTVFSHRKEDVNNFKAPNLELVNDTKRIASQIIWDYYSTIAWGFFNKNEEIDLVNNPRCFWIISYIQDYELRYMKLYDSTSIFKHLFKMLFDSGNDRAEQFKQLDELHSNFLRGKGSEDIDCMIKVYSKILQ